jgi:transposase
VFPAAHLDGPELDLRLLVDHRERLVRHCIELNSTLQWHLHDLWPELQLPGSSLFYGNWGPRVAGRLARTEQTMRVRIARDELRRIRELTQTIKALESRPRSPAWSPRSRRSCCPSPVSGR